MVWFGMVWYGVVWCGMVWYGIVRYGMVWFESSVDPMECTKGCVMMPPGSIPPMETGEAKGSFHTCCPTFWFFLGRNAISQCSATVDCNKSCQRCSLARCIVRWTGLSSVKSTFSAAHQPAKNCGQRVRDAMGSQVHSWQTLHTA